MGKIFSESFKIQAVKKALNRSSETTLKEITDSLGISRSALGRWIIESRQQKLEVSNPQTMTKETRPHDLNLKERFNHVISCSSLDEKGISHYCRGQGIYPHHISQWKLDFVNGNTSKTQPKITTETKNLRAEISTLKKEIRRKDKALAETAALLVLQKKVHEIWGNGEDN